MMLEMPAGVPPWVLIAGAIVLALLSLLACWLLVGALRRRREQRAHPQATTATEQQNTDDRAKERKERRTQRVVNIATTICIVLYLGLFASSFQAISGFARSFLRREGLMVPATPLTLDGVVIGALFLSLAYVAKQKSPAKANALIWSMTIFAAYCGFSYGDSGDHGSLSAGLYYAVMSIVGMIMFHMVLELFQDAGDYVKGKYPAMGWRWITHWSTLPVMLAWINHPPRRDHITERPSVREAIDHWRHVKNVRARAARIRASILHEQALVDARRKVELAAARRIAEQAAAPPAPAAPAAPVVAAPAPAAPAPTMPSYPLPAPAVNGHSFAANGHAMPVTNGHGQALAAAEANGRPVTATARIDDAVPVPNTPAGVEQWIGNWITVCQNAPSIALQQVREPTDQDCKDQFGFSYKQLTKVRKAARTGALRARAAEFGVPVPDEFVDEPQPAANVAQPVG